MPGPESLRDRPVAVVARDAGDAALFAVPGNATMLVRACSVRTDAVAMLCRTPAIRSGKLTSIMPSATPPALSAFLGAAFAGASFSSGDLRWRALFTAENADVQYLEQRFGSGPADNYSVRVRSRFEVIVAAAFNRMKFRSIIVAITQAVFAA